MEVATETLADPLAGCLAAGVVDLMRGGLVRVRYSDGASLEALERAASAVDDLFLGSDVSAIHGAFASVDPTKREDSAFKELVVASPDLVYVFLRGGPDDRLVLVVIARASADRASVIAKVRDAALTFKHGSGSLTW